MTPKNCDKLVENYIVEYNKNNNDFLLFDLAHANENSHTRVLLNLLKYNKNYFFQSFLTRLGLPQLYQNSGDGIEITDQKEAIPNSDKDKAKGYIDLYMNYKVDNDHDVHIIIENKIYGATDTKRQLARYVATIEGIGNNFDEWYKNPSLNKTIYVVYLTFDGSKVPNEGMKKEGDYSLPENLKKKLNNNYLLINYQDDIIPWLEEDVLPYIPYSKDGMMIAGIRQYIAYLYSNKREEVSNLINTYVDEISGGDVEKYSRLQNDIKSIKKMIGKDKDTILQSLIRELSVKAESIFKNDVKDIDGDWILHFTPSFFILYKRSWADLDKRKYSIPSLNFVGNSNSFLNKGETKLYAQVDHLPYDHGTSNDDTIKLKIGNHNKTASFELEVVENCDNVNDPETRGRFYENLLCHVKKFISKMDTATEEIEKDMRNNGTAKFQQSLLEKLIEKWKE